MKRVKVILKRDVEGLGREGEIVVVKYGYAANYLIPKGYAIYGSPSNIKHHMDIMEMKKRKLERLKRKAQELKQQLEKEELEIYANVGEEGKLYGSITSKDIAVRLKDRGYEVDRKDILLEEPIKAIGKYRVKVRLHPEVYAEVLVHVKKEE